MERRHLRGWQRGKTSACQLDSDRSDDGGYISDQSGGALVRHDGQAGRLAATYRPQQLYRLCYLLSPSWLPRALDIRSTDLPLPLPRQRLQYRWHGGRWAVATRAFPV